MQELKKKDEKKEIKKAMCYGWEERWAYFFMCPNCGYDDVIYESNYCGMCGIRVDATDKSKYED